MPDQEKTCKICGKPKESSKSGSMTQFIAACSCEALKQAQTQLDITIRFCTICGKRVGKGRKGSITQYVFRADSCSCDNPIGVDRTFSSTFESHSMYETVEDFDKHIEIDESLQFDSNNFPVDRYKPLKRLGTGGAGEVCLAKDVMLNKLVAVKTLAFLDEEQLISFQEEAKATSRLKHPNIIEILDFGVTGSGTPYMVLEYFNDTTFKHLIEENKTLPWNIVREVIISVSHALSFSHKQGIFHRDIKPSNILLSFESDEIQVKLIDFGIAKVSNPTEKTTDFQGKTLSGTPAYMSPDVVLGYQYSAKSEIYSLGCVIFEALTGTLPFSGESALDTLNMHATSEPPAMSSRTDNEIPDQAKELVALCLNKDPQERFESIDEFLKFMDYLEESAPKEEESLLEEEAPEETNEQSKEAKKSKLPIWLIAVPGVIVALICAALGFTLMPNNPEEKRPVAKDKNEASAQFKYTAISKSFGIYDANWVLPRKARGKISDADLKKIASDLSSRSKLALDLSEFDIKGDGFKYLNNLDLFALSFDKTNFDNPKLSGLKMDSLQVLDFSNSKISDEGLSSLSNLKNLRAISLTNCKNITDSAVCNLIKTHTLEELYLADTMVTDKSLACMANSKLTRLTFGKTNISNEGLKNLIGLSTLKYLMVNQCKNVSFSMIKKICDKNQKMKGLGLAYLKTDGLTISFIKQCPKMRFLNLLGYPLTDEDLKMLGGMKKIAYLFMSDAKFTDKGLPYLASLKLKAISVQRCKNSSSEAFTKLEKKLPVSCVILTDMKSKESSLKNLEFIETLYKKSE